MKCDAFKRHEEGSLADREFARHLEGCPECREEAARDAGLDREIAALRKAPLPEGLWDRIETSLRREKEIAAVREKRLSPRRSAWGFRRWAVLAPAGAALLALVVFTVTTQRKPSVPSGILTSRALAKVEVKEKEYMEAIDALAREAKPKMAAMDIQMMSLYRDKLATIDAQIDRCREALDKNPGNAHIRGYLMAALQDKKEALAGMLGPT